MLVLFIWGRLRYDLTALLGLLASLAAGIVPVDKAFVGFGDQVVIIVASALVISAGVAKSGVIGRMIRRIEPLMRTPSLQVAVLASAVAMLSSFVKNIGALAILLPIALQIAKRSGTPASTLLMPMAFASLMGGLVTLVGTSPNIVVSRVRAELLGAPYAMFDFAPVGLGIAFAGLAFLVVGWRLLPRERRGQSSAEDAFDVDPYVLEAVLPQASSFVGKTVADLEALGEGNVAVIAIIREKSRSHVPAEHWVLFADDILVLQGSAHSLRGLAEEAGLNIVGTFKRPGPADIGVVEAVVMAGSPLVNRTPIELRLRDRFGVNLVAISRPGGPPQVRLLGVRFQAGDVLVLQGRIEGIAEILRSLECLPLIDRATGLGEPRKDYLPLAVLALAVVAVASSKVPVTAAFFGAAVVLVLTQVLTLREAYQAVDPPILILLACLIPVSDAVTSTGAAELVASGLAVVAGALPSIGAVALVMVVAMALTPFLNNAAAVLIMAPIGVSIAEKLGLSPDPFLMAVAIGAACDFLTPIGHQCNTLVMGPGGYRFGDYWRLGLPLSIIVLVTGTLLIPIFWRV
jgi:di/tricarboxylate transporter